MSRFFFRTAAMLLVLAASGWIAGIVPAWSDDDKHERYEESENSESGARKWFVFKREKTVGVVENAVYQKECGSCHFAFQPALLPSGSWKKLMAGLEDHFGDNATLDAATGQEITDYLVKNAAEFSNSKRSYKILRSLKGTEPLRITEVPYIKQEHHEISPRTLERKKITSLANCNVCHQQAAKGIYED